MSDVKFTVDLDELAQLAKSLGTIYTTFTQMPAHQPVDDAAIGNDRLAAEFADFLNGWHDGRKKIELEIQTIAKHVEQAVEEYTVAEHSVTMGESDLSKGVGTSVGVGMALTGSFAVLSKVANGVEVTDPTFTATKGVMPATVAATRSTNATDATVQGDVGMSDPTFTPTTGVASEVATADREATQVDDAVRQGLGMGPLGAGTPQRGDPTLIPPATVAPAPLTGPPQMMHLPVNPPRMNTLPPSNFKLPGNITANPIPAGPPEGLHLPDGQSPPSGSTTL